MQHACDYHDFSFKKDKDFFSDERGLGDLRACVKRTRGKQIQNYTQLPLFYMPITTTTRTTTT